MIKLVALLKRRTGMSREAFISYYEERHAPLARKITAMGHDYRRNYVTVARRDGVEVAESPDFDVMTEVWFKDRDAYEAFRASMLDPDVRSQIVQDEEQFLDRAASRIYIVEERM